MRTRRAPLLAAIALSLALPASVAATPVAHVYHGTFTTASFLCGGATDGPYEAWGNWNVTIVGDQAVVHVDLFADLWWLPRHHIDAFGGASVGQWQVIAPAVDETFHLQLPVDPLGSTDEFILRGDALEFTIHPYGPCDSGTTLGALR